MQARPLRVVDVALWYGERSGGIRTYLDAKVAHARATRAFEHHVVVPGPRERHDRGRHELPSLRLVAANGYRVPLGARALGRTLEQLRPDVVLLHDPFWLPLHVTEKAHSLGARVVAVHHGSAALDAAGMPGSPRLWEPVFRAWLRHAYAPVDAIASVVDPEPDCGRPATFPLLLGVDDAFRPQPDVCRGDHVGLDPDETRRAVEAGRRVLRLAGVRPRGFVLPAYAYTDALRETLAGSFDWWAGLVRVYGRSGPTLAPALTLGTSTAVKRLASPWLVRAGALGASNLLRLDLHPADLDHPRHIGAVEGVLKRAQRHVRRAVTYDDLA